MRTTWCILVLAACLPGLILAAGKADDKPSYDPGKAVDVLFPALDKKIQVFVPKNYTADRKWPAVFFYHGQNGSPDTAFISGLAEQKDWIVVGMTYARRGAMPATSKDYGSWLDQETKNLDAALKFIGGDLMLDPRRIYLGGASKGGWLTCAVGERRLGKLAGFVVVLAGRQRAGVPNPVGGIMRNKAVYIGAGDADPNLVPARKAAEFYAQYGPAPVTFEEYPGTGHSLPKEAPGLKAWLAAQGPLRDTAKEAAGDLKKAFSERYALAKVEKDPMTKYTMLRQIAEDPRLPLCGTHTLRTIQYEVTQIQGLSPVREEWLAEKTYRRWILKSYMVSTPQDMQQVIAGLQGLVNAYPDTRFGKLAAPELEMAQKHYGQVVAAVAKARASQKTTKSGPVSPEFPTTGARRTSPAITRKGGTTVYSFRK